MAAPSHASEPLIARLRAQGAQQVDTVRFHRIQALARRAAAQQGALRCMLDQQLAPLLAACGARLAQARAEASQALPALQQRFPQAAAALQRLHDDGDFAGMHRLAAGLQAQAGDGALAGLLRHINSRAAGQHGQATAAASSADQPPELQAMQQFRSTWARLSIDRQLARSLATLPENPGPLNSQLLVQRALRLMQDISPAYLQRFMAHADALLWLDQANAGSPAVPGKPARPRKPARGAKPG